MIAALTLEQAVRSTQRPLRWALLGCIGLITLAHVVITWAPTGTYPAALVDLVHVDREHNIPTWFSSAQIVVLAFLFFALALHETLTRRRLVARAFWWLCSGVTLFLSMDETAEIHEGLGGLAGALFRHAQPGTLTYWASTFPSYYWALVYVPIAVPCFVVFGWFAMKEMTGSRVLAISGLVLFAMGAVVLDHLEGRFGNAAHQGLQLALLGSAYRFDIFLVEELCELFGVFLLIEGMLRHLLRVLREAPAPLS